MPVEPLPTPSAKAVGPYSPAVRAGDWIVVSGQIGIDPATGALVAGGIEAQARQALANLTAILGDCGCDWEQVAKVTLFVAEESPQSMPGVNAVYSDAVGEHRPSPDNDRPSRPLPARSTVGVAWLPMGAAFEIEAWVYKPQNQPHEKTEA
jgi:2-iminobutanoate/2-iminopropanoate deaminase